MAEQEPRPGDVLGDRYEVREELGRGGMATVFRGRDLRLQRPVAVKVFRGSFAEAVDPKRTAQEMRLLAAVSHPSVVSVLDASNGDGVHGAFLVMELVEGDDLGALLHRARGALAADFARRIVADVAAALAALHARGVVHRDVKPANILVPTGAHAPGTAVAAKLTDFGIAQLVDDARLTAPESIIGTAAYLSPEQVRGMPPRPESDVYSLGLVLLEALTGARAFPGPAAEAAMARLHRPPSLPRDASPALAELLTRMVALDPAHRPSAATVATALRGELVGGFIALDATQTAPTPIAGTPRQAPARTGAAVGPDATMPQEPLFTPSRGMPLGTGRTPVVTGAVPATGARAKRFPTLLAVAASALAAAVAGVAISTLTGVQATPDSAAGAPTAAAAPAAAPKQEAPKQEPAPAGWTAPSRTTRPTPTPTPTRTTPTPTPTATTPTPTLSPSPSPTPTISVPVAPPSAPSQPAPSPSGTPPSSIPTPADSPPPTVLDVPVADVAAPTASSV